MEKVLHRFDIDNAKEVSVPLTQYFKFLAARSPTIDGGVVELLKFSYTQAIGCFIYCKVCTRPDITHVVSVVSK